MKTTQTCPKCQSKRLWLIEEFRLPNPEHDNGVFALPVATMSGRFDKAGAFEVWVCSQCGFTEWYGKNANERLSQFVLRPESGVRWIDNARQTGPFRRQISEIASKIKQTLKGLRDLRTRIKDAHLSPQLRQRKA